MNKQDRNADIEEIHRLLKVAYNTYQDDDGYANISSAGAFIKRTKPDFDLRTYGYIKFLEMLRDFPEKYKIKRKGKGAVTIIMYKCL